MKERHAAASVEAPELKKRDIEKLYYRNVALPLYRNRKSSGQNPCMVQSGFWTHVAGNIPFAIAGYVVGYGAGTYLAVRYFVWPVFIKPIVAAFTGGS